MINEKTTIKCESVFSDDHLHRYSWKRVWDKDKPIAAVLMLNPCQADNIITDTTTSLVVNNIAKLESFGGVVVINLYSRLTNKLHFRWNADEDLNTPSNDEHIRKAAEDCSMVILAWGKAADTNQRIDARAKDVLAMLHDCKDKLMVISDGKRSGLHPLTHSIRKQWILKPFSQNENSIQEKAGV